MKSRIISALFLCLFAIPLIIAGGRVFALAVGLIGALGFKEMLELKKSHRPIPLCLSALFYISFFLIIYISLFQYAYFARILTFSLFVYLLPTLYYKDAYTTQDAFYSLGVTLFLGLACQGVLLIRNQSLWLFLYFLLVILGTDICTFFFGKFIGKHSLSQISPHKTIEGSVFGTFVITLLGTLFYIYIFVPRHVFGILILTMALSIVGQFGDLLFSKIKRENQIKDFSDLIPGHGGILDRFDSVFFSSLFFAIFIPYL